MLTPDDMKPAKTAKAAPKAQSAATGSTKAPAKARKTVQTVPAEKKRVSQNQNRKAPAETASSPAAAVVRQTRLPDRPPRKKLEDTVLQSPVSRAASKSGETKLFVLDTNMLMHDPSALFRFEEHDVYLPMITLEEMDNNKRGTSEIARNVRQTSRYLDALAASADEVLLETGIPLESLGHSDARGRLYFQTTPQPEELLREMAGEKADNLILGVVSTLTTSLPGRAVVLVSKDINMRIKARSLGLAAEDYFNDQVIEDADLLYTGFMELPADFWETHGGDLQSWQENNHHGHNKIFYRVTGPLVSSMVTNQFLFMNNEAEDNHFQAQVKEIDGQTAVLQTLHDYIYPKNNVWGISARNQEQNFALNILMDPECDIVTLAGQAGTGKTLLALAAGLAQMIETKRYNEIIVTRATISVGEDIGFLPGSEEEKMSPWMGAFDDNLEVLNRASHHEGGDWGRAASHDLIRSRISIKSLNFMRGRTFINKFLIIDEAQNLTPKQMKTLITRAGPGTKVVCLGNIAQIDTPYLTEGSSGLTYVVDRFRGWTHSGHIVLVRGERSRLADYASEAL